MKPQFKFASKSVMRLFTVLIFCASDIHAHAAIAIRSPDVRSARFQGLADVRAGTQRLSEALASQGATREQVDLLERELRLAQAAFLGSSLEQAREHFLKVTGLAREADWSASARRSIHYAYLRLGQIAASDLERSRYLHDAARFAPDLKGNAKLFPPPLLRKLENAQNDVVSASTRIDFNQQFEGFEVVIVDGRRFDLPLNGDVVVTPGEHRFSFFSDAYSPQSLVLNSSQVAVFQPLRQTLIDGDCETPVRIMPDYLKGKSVTAVQSDTCIKTLVEGVWIQGWENPIVSSASAQASIQTSLGLNQKGQPLDRWPSAPLEKPRPFYKKTWFLVGLGAVVATSAVLMQKQNERHRANAAQDPVVQPTSSEGL